MTIPKLITYRARLNGYYFDITGSLTFPVEDAIENLAIAVADYLKSVIDEMSWEDRSIMKERIEELLPLKECNWRRCISTIAGENSKLNGVMGRLEREGAFTLEFDLTDISTAGGSNRFDLEISWRRARAKLYSFLGMGSEEPISKVPNEYFAGADWWWSVAERLRDQGEDKAADAVLMDPYCYIVRQEMCLISAIGESAKKVIIY